MSAEESNWVDLLEYCAWAADKWGFAINVIIQKSTEA